MYKVVVVEDSSLLRKGLIFTTPWEDIECEVIGEAENGIEGAEIIEKLHPDIVITDIKMPGLDGIEMIEKVISKTNTVFIIMSGYSEFEYARSALKLGVKDYLLKPIDDDELLNSIKRACDEIHQKKQLDKLKYQMDKTSDSRIIFFKEYFSCDDTTKSTYVQNAVDYIKNNYASDIGVKDIAKSLMISDSHISRSFKEETVYTIGDYLSNYRIKKACKLLSNLSAKIYEIAEQIGYKDHRHFSVPFKKIVGVTPKEFKDKLNNH